MGNIASKSSFSSTAGCRFATQMASQTRASLVRWSCRCTSLCQEAVARASFTSSLSTKRHRPSSSSSGSIRCTRSTRSWWSRARWRSWLSETTLTTFSGLSSKRTSPKAWQASRRRQSWCQVWLMSTWWPWLSECKVSARPLASSRSVHSMSASASHHILPSERRLKVILWSQVLVSRECPGIFKGKYSVICHWTHQWTSLFIRVCAFWVETSTRLSARRGGRCCSGTKKSLRKHSLA